MRRRRQARHDLLIGSIARIGVHVSGESGLSPNRFPKYRTVILTYFPKYMTQKLTSHKGLPKDSNLTKRHKNTDDGGPA